MTDAERAYLLDQLETSKQKLLASIDGLSPAQWKFKPAPNVWSVAECSEHIILAESLLFNWAQKGLASPATTRPDSSNTDFDRTLVAKTEDRSQKGTAPEALVPSGKFATPADAAREFTARRDKTIAYVKTTDAPLRTHTVQAPFGTVDIYQCLLVIAAHSARHTAQIREVESNPSYPKAAATISHTLGAIFPASLVSAPR